MPTDKMDYEKEDYAVQKEKTKKGTKKPKKKESYTFKKLYMS